jgi:endonuclease YncB( thermonuclease family)
MDLTVYYEKIREAKSKIKDEFVVATSMATPDGGRAGVCSEVPRAVAARMIVDGLIRTATAAEEKAYREAQAKAKKMADDLAASAKVTFNVISQTATVEKE